MWVVASRRRETGGMVGGEGRADVGACEREGERERERERGREREIINI